MMCLIVTSICLSDVIGMIIDIVLLLQIPYSVAVRHQRLLCTNLLQEKFFDYDLPSGSSKCYALYTCLCVHIFECV